MEAQCEYEEINAAKLAGANRSSKECKFVE